MVAEAKARVGRSEPIVLLGLTFFCLQTAVLDALVRPYFFPLGW